MTTERLDDKLDCKKCGTILMDIPNDADDHTLIHCSKCGTLLSKWGELQDNFAGQIRDAEVIDLNHGTMVKKS